MEHAESKHKTSPKVSIGLPVYNGEAYLEETINNLLSQSFKDFELIICDNASTDTTETICENAAANDSRVQYYRNSKNIGAAKNYNRTFELSKGQYFKWVAADDLLAEEFLERCVEILDNQPGCTLAYSKGKIINDKGKVIRDVGDKPVSENVRPSERFRELLYGLSECIPIFGLFRRTILAKSPLIGGFIGSDRVVIKHAALSGEIFEIPDYLFFLRKHPQASTVAFQNNSSERDIEQLTSWYDPSRAGKLNVDLSRRIYNFWKMIFKSEISPIEKLRILFILVRYSIWKRDIIGKEFVYSLHYLMFKLSGRKRKADRVSNDNDESTSLSPDLKLHNS